MRAKTTRRRPTLVEVAQLAGVSVATASRALRRSSRVAQPTRSRVEVAANELGFTRNALASELRVGAASSMVGFIVASLEDPFFAAVAAGLQEAAAEHHLDVMIACHHGRPDELKRIVLTMVAQRTRCIVFVPTPGTLPQALRREAELGTSFVSLDAPAPELSCDAVVADNRDAARRITGHLLMRGHRRFVVVALSLEHWTQQERLTAIQETLRLVGVLVSESQVRTARPGADLTVAEARSLLAEHRPDVVIGLSILPLVAAVRAARELRMSPEFACFDGNPLFDLLPERVLGVVQDPRAIGRTAIERVCAIGAEHAAGAAVTSVLPCHGPFVWGARDD